MVRTATLASCALVVTGALAYRQYPLYRQLRYQLDTAIVDIMQCDPSWGSDEMGVPGPGERSTICGEGCAMTSVAMALAGIGATVNGGVPTPKSLNKWLMANGGYMCAAGDCNNLVLDAPTRLNATFTLIGEVPKPSATSIAQGLADGSVVYVAHVHNNGHFVLLTGVDASNPDAFTVNDPFYNSTSYPYDNITDIIMYAIVPAHSETRTHLRAGMPWFAPAHVHGNTAARQPAPPSLRAPNPVIPFAYPLYKQCDSRWGNDIMVTETVCAVGCLMSATSMALGGKNITVQGNTSNPGTFNAWLRTHNGYDSGNDLIEENVPALNPTHVQWPSDGMHTTNDIPLTQIQQYLTSGRPVIAWVMNKQHFVLVIGWDANAPDTLYVNDPGFDRQTYSYTNDVVGWRLWQIQGCSKPCSA